MLSQRQLEANRRNAQKSTGPKPPQGKAVASRNALKHGLTAQDAVISDEERPHFEEALAAFQAEHQPVGPTQALLLEQIVTAAWRLRRLRGMETRLFDLRMQDLAKYIERERPELDSHGRHAYVFLSDARGVNALTTLSRYETRTERAFYRALHELPSVPT
jgi:hypothetical protein